MYCPDTAFKCNGEGPDGENDSGTPGCLFDPWCCRDRRVFLTGFPALEVQVSFANEEERGDSHVVDLAVISLNAFDIGKRID